FERAGITYVVSERNRSQLYEALEPLMNGRRIVLLDIPELVQQLLGLIWRGGKIDHPSGEHDDWANAAAGAIVGAVGEEPLRLTNTLLGSLSVDQLQDMQDKDDARAARMSNEAIERACRANGSWFPG